MCSIVFFSLLFEVRLCISPSLSLCCLRYDCVFHRLFSLLFEVPLCVVHLLFLSVVVSFPLSFCLPVSLQISFSVFLCLFTVCVCSSVCFSVCLSLSVAPFLSVALSESLVCACLFVGWLLNVPATCECISGTGLLSQLYVLPH